MGSEEEPNRDKSQHQIRDGKGKDPTALASPTSAIKLAYDINNSKSTSHIGQHRKDSYCTGLKETTSDDEISTKPILNFLPTSLSPTFPGFQSLRSFGMSTQEYKTVPLSHTSTESNLERQKVQYSFSALLKQCLDDPVAAYKEYEALQKKGLRRKALDENAGGSPAYQEMASDIAFGKRQLVAFVRAKIVELLAEKIERDAFEERETKAAAQAFVGIDGEVNDLQSLKETIHKEVEMIGEEEWGVQFSWNSDNDEDYICTSGGEDEDEDEDDEISSKTKLRSRSRSHSIESEDEGDAGSDDGEATSDNNTTVISEKLSLILHFLSKSSQHIITAFYFGYTALTYTGTQLPYLWKAMLSLLYFIGRFILVFVKAASFIVILFLTLYLMVLAIHGVAIVAQGVCTFSGTVCHLAIDFGMFISRLVITLVELAFASTGTDNGLDGTISTQLRNDLNDATPLFATSLSGPLDSVVQLSEMTGWLTSMSLMLGTLSSSISSCESVVLASSLVLKGPLSNAYSSLFLNVDQYKDYLEDIGCTLSSIVQKTEIELAITVQALGRLTKPRISSRSALLYSSEIHLPALLARLKRLLVGPNDAEVAVKKREEAERAKLYSQIANSFYEFINTLDKELDAASSLIEKARASMKIVVDLSGQVDALRLAAERDVKLSSSSLVNELKGYPTAATVVRDGDSKEPSESISLPQLQPPPSGSKLYCLVTFYLPRSCILDPTKHESNIRLAQHNERKRLYFDLQVAEMDVRAIKHLVRFQEVSRERLSLVERSIVETRWALKIARDAVERIEGRHKSREGWDQSNVKKMHEYTSISSLVDEIRTEIAFLAQQMTRFSNTKHFIVKQREEVGNWWQERIQSCDHRDKDERYACIWDGAWAGETISETTENVVKTGKGEGDKSDK